VMDEKGQILVMGEDLTASFARAISRAGSAAANLKRYSIAKTFQKATLSGLHPREQLEGERAKRATKWLQTATNY